MKKLISLALAIVMIISLSTTVLATEAQAPGANTAEVTGNYVAGNESNGIVYCVEIEWEDLNFTYKAEKGAIWDTTELKYSEKTPADWEGEGKITVTNRSNTKITAVPEYAPEEGFEDADMLFSTDKLRVASAEVGTAQKGEITVTPDGFLPPMEEAATIGYITLTIAQDTDVTLEEARKFAYDVMMFVAISNTDGVYDMYIDEFATLEASARYLETTIEQFENGTADQEELNSAYKTTQSYYDICAELKQQQ